MIDDTGIPDTTVDTDDDVLDLEAVNADIAAGGKALSQLFDHAKDDFTRWAIAIRGLRGLRDLAFAKAHTRNIMSHHYRQELGALLQLRKHSIYDRIDKQTRSSCYKLMDRIDEIADWYASLAPTDQMRWKHPDSIVKHCPQHLLAGKGHNKPPRKIGTGRPKRASTAEEDRLRQILILLINEFVAPVNPRRASELLKQVYPEGDPNDSIAGMLDESDAEAESEDGEEI
jgi:hypothetical protein